MNELLDVFTLKKSREDFGKLIEEPSFARALQSLQAVTSILMMVSPEFVAYIAAIYEKFGAESIAQMLTTLDHELIRKIGLFHLLLLQIPKQEAVGLSTIELLARHTRRIVLERLRGNQPGL